MYLRVMELIDIKPGDRLWNEVWALYESSFPGKERRGAAGHAALAGDPSYRAKAAVDDAGDLLGLLFFWDNGDCLYIEHLAVNASMRGQNVGSRLLSGFLEANPGRKVVLEIDPPEDGISIRRLRFYERLGFVANPYRYIHPGFGSRSEAIPHRLVLMTYPGEMTPGEFVRFEEYVNGHVAPVTD